MEWNQSIYPCDDLSHVFSFLYTSIAIRATFISPVIETIIDAVVEAIGGKLESPF